jgi:hypothetical protein
MADGPLNYTTVIEPSKTAAECVARLATHGATAIGLTYDAGFPTGLQFQIDTAHGLQAYALPVNVDGTLKALQRAWRQHRIPQSKATLEQARRTGWRVIKNWLEAQLALIDAGVADMAEVMLPWMLVDGQTVYQTFLERNQLALTQGET